MSLRHAGDSDNWCNWNIGHLHQPPFSALLDVSDSTEPDIALYIDAGGGDGDILCRGNVEQLHKDVSKVLQRRQLGAYVDLVTADGGMDFDKSHTEQSASGLLWGQVAAMIQSINAGGTFIVKFFSNHEVRAVF